jgi:ribosome-associated protein
MESLDKAVLSLNLARERKAVNPVLLEVEGMTSLTDYFLIVCGGSTRQVQAITRHLVRRLREDGFRAFGVEGEQEGQWVLLDYGDVIIHVFYEPMRTFYDLEGLWAEAPRIHVGGQEGMGDEAEENSQ